MREIPVYEPELDQISLLNTLAAGFLSASSGSVLFVLGLITNKAMTQQLPPQAEIFLEVIVWAGFILGVGFLVAAAWAWHTKNSKLNEMKKFGNPPVSHRETWRAGDS